MTGRGHIDGTGWEDDLHVLAGEYVLGVLEDTDMQAVETRLAFDSSLAAAVTAWQQRLAEIDQTAPELDASESLWNRIAGDIKAPRRAAPPAAARPKSHWWQRLELWRPLALAANAAVLILIVALTVVVVETPEAPQLVAALMSDDGQVGALVEVYDDGRARLLPLTDIAVPEGRVLEVWTKWSEERGPVSLGLLERARSLELGTARLPRATPQQLYEITLEPAGGSPTGRPTGPILFKGLAADIL